jgi:hypothetical protein
MVEVDAKSISLFFFFALLDEMRAIEATTAAIKNYKERVSKNPELKAPVAIVASTYHIWDKNRNRFVRGRHNFSADSGWLFTEGLELGPWKEFQKTAQEDEFLALIWSQILKISDEDISLGLGISVGTLRYRTGRALRKLGQLTNPVFTRPAGQSKLGVVRDE